MTELKVQADARSLRELLEKKKYGIDYYQREYRWHSKQIEELINDLATKFLGQYDSSHERKKVANYKHYFLGSIVISKKGNDKYIVDGQQRLTSLTLLLIYLHHLQEEQGLSNDKSVNVSELIFSKTFNVRSFNLMVEDREDILNALFTGSSFDTSDQSLSVRNVAERYGDIVTMFPDDLKGAALPYFIDWLVECVDLVEITAYNDDDAYTVFETMNDRGLSLNPTEMLKGYLLSKIQTDEAKDKANKAWKNRVSEILKMQQNHELKNEDIDATKTWLRAKYANSIRDGKRRAINKDFEKIGTALHRWVREQVEKVEKVETEEEPKLLNLNMSNDYQIFIQRDFVKFSKIYQTMREASLKMTTDYESIYYNAHNNFTLQYMLALAPILVTDDEETVKQKIKTVTTFIDIYIARRMVNFKTLSYSSIQYTMFNLMKEIRDSSLNDLVQHLRQILINKKTEQFDKVTEYHLHGQNKKHVHYLLARITQHIENESGMDTNFPALINRSGNRKTKRFEVEHIWANHYDRYRDDFDHPEDFERARNRFGGLILLPRGINQSYGDLPYEEKLPHYVKENMLAKSLHPQAYVRNPNFTQYIERSGLPFQAHEQFAPEDQQQRQTLYRELCKQIWNPARLDTVLS